MTRLTFAVSLGLSFFVTAALAQSAAAPPAPAAVPAAPQSTSASFGDWTLGCERVGQSPQQKKVCEVGQTISAKGQNGPLAKFAIGRLNPGDPLRFTAVLPVNMVPTFTPRLAFGDKLAGPVNLAWQRCLPGGCFASVVLDDPTLQRLRAGTDQGRLTFHDASDHEVTLPISLRGVAQALDGLTKEDAAR